MRPLFIFIFISIFIKNPAAQQAIVHDLSIPSEGRLTVLTDDIKIPEEDAGYTLILPQGKKPKAVIVLFHSGRDTSNAGFEMRLYTEAVKRQVACLYVCTGNRFEFLFDEERYEQLDRYIRDAVEKYDLPKDRWLFTGMSLAGTRAMKFGAWCLEGNSSFGLRPNALAVCDAPLDFERFWKALDRSKRLQISEIAANEAKWVTADLERNLGGSPKEKLQAYQSYSPYCYGCPDGGQAAIFSNTPFRAYTEPDVQWWMENRGNDYYSMNAMDAAGVVNQLRILGNKNAELILTEGMGYHPDGRRHPHSWSIVDNGELVEWVLRMKNGE